MTLGATVCARRHPRASGRFRVHGLAEPGPDELAVLHRV